MNKIFSLCASVILAGIITSTIYADVQSSKNSNIQTISSQKVAIKNYSFDPQKLTIETGTTVVWTNDDAVAHNVVFDKFHSQHLVKGTSYSHTFKDKGIYKYTCSIHPAMTGQIIVK
jgi:plastocyanin